MGDLRLKIEAIEVFDEKIVGPILKGMEAFPRYKILVLPDHPDPPFSQDPYRPIRFPMSSTRMKRGRGGTGWRRLMRCLQAGAAIYVKNGYELIERFLNS